MMDLQLRGHKVQAATRGSDMTRATDIGEWNERTDHLLKSFFFVTDAIDNDAD